MEQRSIIVGRNNAPAFSRRWLSDNSFHVRTLNPFEATALGMGAITHGNDCGGSIRHPAWACGVVGQCTTEMSGCRPTQPRGGLPKQGTFTGSYEHDRSR